MELFIVQNNPIIARADPIPSASIVNAYKVGTKIPIVKLDSGWYQTESGSYIFKTQDIIPYKVWLKDHRHELDDKDTDLVPPSLKRVLRKYGGAIEIGDVVRLKSNDVTDTNTSNRLPQSLFDNKILLTVTKVEADKVTISDSNTSYTIPSSAVEIVDTASIQSKPVSSGNATQEEVDTAVGAVQRVVQSAMSTFSYGIDKLDTQCIRSVFGMPYQYNAITDPRLDGTLDDNSIGHMYAQKIAARAPILVMQPGVPDFLRGFDKESQGTILRTLAGVSSNAGGTLEQMVNQPGMYYGFKVKSGQYYNAVNAMCRAMAILLGVNNHEWKIGDGETTLLGGDKYSWENNSAGPFFGYNNGVVLFYINSDKQINESFVNEIQPSMISQQINQFAKMGSELQFVLGGAANFTGIDFTSDLNKDGKKQYSTGGLLESIADNIHTIIAGARMSFPQIWGDSKFARTYSVNIKLISPSADNLSVYLNIFVPLAHILAFVLPRSIGMNNYVSPFLVRAFYRSMFHVDMGIVTDCQIQRGEDGSWSQLGMPTQINVQLTIKDLYDVMSLALGGEFYGNQITSNPLQMDYIANLCGINIDEPDLIGKAIKLWWAINNPLNAIPAALRLQGVQLLGSAYQTITGLITRTLFGRGSRY